MLKRSTRILLAVIPVVVFAIIAMSASPAFADSAWWHLSSTSRPTDLQSEGRGEIVVTAANLGDASIDGATSPVTIADKLPAGLRAVSISGESGTISRGSVMCPTSKELKEGVALACTYSGTFNDDGKIVPATLPPYGAIEVRIGVEVSESTVSGESNEVSVSGGGTPAASLSRPIVVSEGTPFGLSDYEQAYEEPGGALDFLAGSHPFQQTVSFAFNQDAATGAGTNYEAHAPSLPKDVAVNLPAGVVGNPDPFPRCTIAQFLSHNVPEYGDIIGQADVNACSAQTAVGVAVVSISVPELGVQRWIVPLFNLEPYFGEPARFGFFIPPTTTPILIDTALRNGPGGEYSITATSTNISQIEDFFSSEITIWGVPGDPRHDSSRGWACLGHSEGVAFPSCQRTSQAHPQALLSMPTSCTGPLHGGIEVDSWANPSEPVSIATTQPMGALDGCNRLSFSPSISAEPTTDRASAPSGLDFNLNFDDEGLTAGEGVAQSQMKDTVVSLPEGLTINPSAGVGLGGCTPADYARETIESIPGAGCPNNSKLGTVEIETPLLTQKIHGSIFIAQPHENPFNSLVGLYVVAKNPETGVLIKLAGKVTPNPVTGQLTTTFENNPQVPFDHFNFHFREGQQAPLVSPPTCGTYSTRAQLTPWSEPAALLTYTSSFTITKGYEGGECPSGGAPPFHPGIQSGMLNNNGGAFSPFYLHLTRTDGDQEIAGFSTNLPEGLTGDLSGIPFCPEADIEAARHKTGAEEEANPSCPAASQIGHTLVGTGVGAVLAYVPGKIYLAGPFHGAPFSIVSVTSAVVGPFDLGTVVLRFGLSIDPYTARVSVTPTSSEPIPTIIDGIVTHVRDIRVYIDRPNFTLNPTSCNPLAISSTLTSNLGANATVSSPFQDASCANLAFAPKFAVSTSGRTSRANGASLAVKLSYPLGAAGSYANIAKVKVELPKQLPSRLTTLQKACKSVQFETDPAGCPAASIIGHAKAVTPLIPVPLEGPAYFVSHGGEAFPSLIMVLQGYGVTIDLVGSTFINKAGITSSTFKAVPDQPVGSFELTLPEGQYSALAANGNLCKSKLAMPTEFVAQNGAVLKQSTKIKVENCPKAKTKRTKKKAGRHGRKGRGRGRRK